MSWTTCSCTTSTIWTRVVETNIEGRIEVAEQAEDIIREEVERMMLRLKTREVDAHHRQPAGTAGAVAHG